MNSFLRLKQSSSVIFSSELVRSVNNERDRPVKISGFECQVARFQRQIMNLKLQTVM